MTTLTTIKTALADCIARYRQACIHRDSDTTAIVEECCSQIITQKKSLLDLYPTSSLSDKINILGLLSRIESLSSSPDYRFIDKEISILKTSPSLSLTQRALLALMSESTSDSELRYYLKALGKVIRESATPDPETAETATILASTLGVAV